MALVGIIVLSGTLAVVQVSMQVFGAEGSRWTISYYRGARVQRKPFPLQLLVLHAPLRLQPVQQLCTWHEAPSSNNLCMPLPRQRAVQCTLFLFLLYLRDCCFGVGVCC